MALKERTQAEKVAAAKQYGKDRIAWEKVARGILAGEPAEPEATDKVLAAKKLRELAGSDKMAFLILDATMVALAAP